MGEESKQEMIDHFDDHFVHTHSPNHALSAIPLSLSLFLFPSLSSFLSQYFFIFCFFLNFSSFLHPCESVSNSIFSVQSLLENVVNHLVLLAFLSMTIFLLFHSLFFSLSLSLFLSFFCSLSFSLFHISSCSVEEEEKSESFFTVPLMSG